jgi:hypothetical protein
MFDRLTTLPHGLRVFVEALLYGLRTSTESVARGAAKAGVETANRFDLGS